MKNTAILTSFIALTIATPALAADHFNALNPTYDYVKENAIYDPGSANSGVLDGVDGSPNNDNVNAIPYYNILPGYYLKTGEYLVSDCPAVSKLEDGVGKYCPGVSNAYYKTSGDDQVVTSCATGYLSFGGAGSTDECYKQCTLQMNQHMTAVDGYTYQGTTFSTCRAATCEPGYTNNSLNISGLLSYRHISGTMYHEWRSAASGSTKQEATGTLRSGDGTTKKDLAAGQWAVYYDEANTEFEHSYAYGDSGCFTETGTIISGNGTTGGKYCFCKLAGVNIGGVESSAVAGRWVRFGIANTASDCTNSCAQTCAYEISAKGSEKAVKIARNSTNTLSLQSQCVQSVFTVYLKNGTDTIDIVRATFNELMPSTNTSGNALTVPTKLNSVFKSYKDAANNTIYYQYDATNDTVKPTSQKWGVTSGNSYDLAAQFSDCVCNIPTGATSKVKSCQSNNTPTVNNKCGFSVVFENGYYGQSIQYSDPGNESVEVEVADCTNKPQGASSYTGYATTNACPWECAAGYGVNAGSTTSGSGDASGTTCLPRRFTIAYNDGKPEGTGSTFVNPEANPDSYQVTSNTITLVDPTLLGYTFNGWTVSSFPTAWGASSSCTSTSSCSGKKNFKIATGTYGDIGLTATWSANISGAITLDGGRWATENSHTNATTAVSPATVYSKYDNGIYTASTATASSKITSVTPPTLRGYTFSGFYTTKVTGGDKVINADGTFTELAKTQVAEAGATAAWYARWTANDINIIWHGIANAQVKLSDGSSMTEFANNTAKSSVKYDGDISTPVAAMQQTGQVFLGWRFVKPSN